MLATFPGSGWMVNEASIRKAGGLAAVHPSESVSEKSKCALPEDDIRIE